MLGRKREKGAGAASGALGRVLRELVRDPRVDRLPLCDLLVQRAPKTANFELHEATVRVSGQVSLRCCYDFNDWRSIGERCIFIDIRGIYA